jgi:RimJ/RimL family protein N-acetyltransferase
MTRGQWELRQDMACGFWDRERGRYLGGTGLHPIDWGVPSFEIGYWIRASEAGKGYTTEAARLLTRAAFEHLGAHRVQIRVATENAASLKIPAKLKYVEEGVSRNAIRYADGALYDLVIFAMTRSRYESLWPYQ